MRANEILSDGQQREAYDHMLELARQEQEQEAKRVVAARLHKVASGVMAIAGASAATVGGYLLFLHMSAAPIAQLRPSVVAIDRIKLNASPAKPIEIAAVTSDLAAAPPEDSPTAPIETTAVILPVEKRPLPIETAEDPYASEEDHMPCAISHATNACGAEVTAVLPPSSPGINDARFYHDRGMAFYRKGDMLAAVSDLDQAIQLDPKFSAAFIDRGIVFYRMRKFDRAFADVSRARRIEKANRTVLDAMAKKQLRPLRLEPPKVTRVSQRHTSGVPD